MNKHENDTLKLRADHMKVTHKLVSANDTKFPELTECLLCSLRNGAAWCWLAGAHEIAEFVGLSKTECAKLFGGMCCSTYLPERRCPETH